MHKEGRVACECAILYPDLMLVFGLTTLAYLVLPLIVIVWSY